MLQSLDGVIDDMAGVHNVGGGDTACFWGIWGKQGGQGTSMGCSDGSRSVSHRSTAVVHGPEQGIAGGDVVDGDMHLNVVAMGMDM